MKRWLLGVALVALGLGVIAQQVELVFWHQEARPHRVQRYEELCARFNAEHPNIKITPVMKTWTNIYQEASAAIMAGKGPDFILSTGDFITYIQHLGLVQPVDDIIEELRQQYTIFPSYLQQLCFGGHCWAVPIYGMDFVLWYRKDIFEKAGLDPNRPPRTWSELIATCEKLKQSGVVEYPIAVPGAIHLATDQLIYTLMVVAGAEHLFGENPNEIVFNNPNTVKAYAFYKQLFSYSPPGSETWRWDEPRTALFTGKVAMVMEKGHYIKGWVDNTNLPLDYLGCGFIPIPDEGGQPGTIFYANGLTLLTADPVKREAFKTFIKWLYQPHIMSWLLHMDPGFFLPPTQEVLYSDAFWSDPIIRQKVAAVMIELESLKYGRLPGFTRAEVNPNVGAISAANLLAWTAQLITVKGLSPEEAVALGAQEMAKAVR
jgi:multiple sugar transport system substrate-binding protein